MCAHHSTLFEGSGYLLAIETSRQRYGRGNLVVGKLIIIRTVLISVCRAQQKKKEHSIFRSRFAHLVLNVS